MDSTGLDTCQASRYFVKRRQNCTKVEQIVGYSTFAKLELVCDCATHLILCVFAGVGPMVDISSFRRLLFGILRRVSVGTILTEATRNGEVMLKVLTHNLMLIAAVLLELFYRAAFDPFFEQRAGGPAASPLIVGGMPLPT